MLSCHILGTLCRPPKVKTTKNCNSSVEFFQMLSKENSVIIYSCCSKQDLPCNTNEDILKKNCPCIETYAVKIFMHKKLKCIVKVIQIIKRFNPSSVETQSVKFVLVPQANS